MVHDSDEDEPVAEVRQDFADLGVHPDLVEALAAVGITHPFPIQSMAIPLALAGSDMIGQARTGTGKTLAFGLSLLQRITLRGEPGHEDLGDAVAPQALVVCPTRELASQVSKDLSTAATVRKARVLTVYGGVGYEHQLETLAAGVDVVVGTPGRLLDLVGRRALNLKHIRVLVLDEADEMLDLGFLPDVEKILAQTPAKRQTMLFSATMPSAIVNLSRRHLNQPMNIRAESAEDNTTVPLTTQFIYQAHDLDKPEIVARVLQAEGRDRMMIFCRTKRTAQRVAEDLAGRGFDAAPIHGDLNQTGREKALKKFRDGQLDVLVATDVAARGIDVTGVTHVINYECPDDEKTYVHRIGRTGRAGATGVAITFVDWADTTRWKVINKALGLSFESPVETYSTSAHLFTDLGIAEGVKGRIAPPKEVEERPDGQGPGGPGRDGGRRSGERSPRGGDRAPRETEEREIPRTPRQPSSRTRRRTRNGEVEDGGGTTTATSEAPASSSTAGPSTPAAEGEAGTRPRRRRRRRGGRGGAGEGTSGGSEPTAVQTD
ncbi:DEAD/DEAH box helicase [Auraticoccus monumenti]|uniref:DEAD/DEAH box helicase n=1 Tax=Auraticoccus monumenti TaxID=675864 RepID=UPI0022B252E4|nr:DEAD/DEAH box helicase [Auraticoccus monumenti]